MTITALQREIAKYDEQLQDLQTKIRGLAQHPSARSQELQELETRLSTMRTSLEIAREQKTMYMGTELEEKMIENVEQAEEKVKRLEQQIAEARSKHKGQTVHDEKELKRLQAEEQKATQKRHNLVHMLSDLQKERTIQDTAEGEQRAKLIAARLKEMKEDYDAKRQAAELAEFELQAGQQAALGQLEPWPELQRQVMEEFKIEPSDGPLRVAQAALPYFEALIRERLDLPGVTVAGNESLASVLALTDVEICSEIWQGGMVNLQRKRAALLEFIAKRKAAMVGE